MNPLQYLLAPGPAIAVLAAATAVGSAIGASGHPAAEPVEVWLGHLECGAETFTARTENLDVPEQPRQPLSQKIAGPAGAQLSLDAHALRQPFLQGVEVRDAAATGWACLTSNDGRSFVSVVMTCTESPARPACKGTAREWVRLYDVHGRLLNGGYPRSGPRTPTLMKRIGLGRYLADGVTLSDVQETKAP